MLWLNGHGTHDEYSSPLVPVAVDVVLMHGNARPYVNLGDAIQTLMCFDDWIGVSVSWEVNTSGTLNAVALGLYRRQPIKMP